MSSIWAWRGPLCHERILNDPSGPAIIFVHGLGGKRGSWFNMLEQFQADPALKAYSLSYYEYPSRKFSWPWITPQPSLQELAKGLKTELETNHSERSEIVLVAHSLGGLVARQYVVNELKAGQQPKASRLMLIAAPNTGSSLAKLGSKLSFNEKLLKQLCRRSEILDILNEDWVRTSTETRVPTHYVVGGLDAIVPRESATPFYGSDNVSTLIEYDHFNIIAPTALTDRRFAVIKKFVLAPRATASHEVAHRTVERNADPLFDVYSLQNEPFYTLRSLDPSVKRSLEGGAIWLVGPTGTGKTAALMRCALISGWQLQQVMLGSHVCETADELLHVLCGELASLRSIEVMPPLGTSVADLFKFVRKTLREFPKDKIVGILIEELPLKAGLEFNKFLEYMASLSLSLDSDSELSQRVILAFSSINDPTSGNSALSAKASERMQIVKTTAWPVEELRALATSLRDILNPNLADEDIENILLASRGSPRFIKMLFRKWRNGTDERRSVTDLIAVVRNELS